MITINGLVPQVAEYVIIGIHPCPEKLKLLGSGNNEWTVKYTCAESDPVLYQGGIIRVNEKGDVVSLKNGDAGKEEIV